MFFILVPILFQNIANFFKRGTDLSTKAKCFLSFGRSGVSNLQEVVKLPKLVACAKLHSHWSLNHTAHAGTDLTIIVSSLHRADYMEFQFALRPELFLSL